jgi:hypothetical protein
MTTIAKTMIIRCPQWCTQENYQGHDPSFGVAGELHVDHMGPDFGDDIFGNGAQVDDIVTTEVMVTDLESRTMAPAQLRQLAADALAATEWLEAQADPALA